MAQYKAAMGRIFEDPSAKDDSKLSLEDGSTKFCDENSTSHINNDNNSLILSWLEKHAAFLLMPVAPLVWCLVLISVMDREMLLSACFMPLLGIGSASLANAVPVGGGIVFVPILSLWGVQLKLGTAFAVATMTFGNGVFGFLNWLRKDPKSIAWHVVPWAVFPAWLGSIWNIFNPLLSPDECRHMFAIFCLVVAAIVGRGIFIFSGKKDNSEGKHFSIVESASDEENRDDNPSSKMSLQQKVLLASSFSFFAGFILVAHIGIGNAMTTFLVSSFIWRLPAKSAVVTGILCGGWTSFMPFVIHLFILRDVPIALWIMVLPGVYLGAKIAPLAHELIGITNVLKLFTIFLIGTAVLMFST